LFWFFDIEEKVNFVFNSTFPPTALRTHVFNKHNLQYRNKTMYNHESRKIHYILRSMHYINIHNNSTVIGTTNRTNNSLLPAATNSTSNPIRIIFSEQATSQIQISRNDKFYRQLHQLVLKNRKLVATSSHNLSYIQRIQSRQTLSPTRPYYVY